MTNGVVVGYDPGGDGCHGLAVVIVHREDERAQWATQKICLEVGARLDEALAWVRRKCDGRKIVAAGIDSLTEWNGGPKGWRPADRWLKKMYPQLQGSVVAPNSLRAMAVNGAAFLCQLESRFLRDRTMVTEAHPKVCYYALTSKTYDWASDPRGMASWLFQQLGAPAWAPGFTHLSNQQHAFDAALSALAGLNGLNGRWTLDLHQLPRSCLAGLDRCGVPTPFLRIRTHYWWPCPD